MKDANISSAVGIRQYAGFLYSYLLVFQKQMRDKLGFSLDVIFTGSSVCFASVTEDTSSRALSRLNVG